MSEDDDEYRPKSDFLVSVANEEIPLDDSDFGQSNLRLLIEHTRDDDRSNRDWAAMLLGHFGPHTEDVRLALVSAAEDVDPYVRAEAIHQLVGRDRSLATQLVMRELAEKSVCVVVFDAARDLADPCLVPLLLPFAEASGDDYVDGCVRDALSACQGSDHHGV